MFGMALKLFELDLNPCGGINQNDKQYIKQGSQQNRQRNQYSPNKKSTLSLQNIKQNIPPNFKQNQDAKTIDQKTLQELRQNQKQIIQDFKKSLTVSQIQMETQQNQQQNQNPSYILKHNSYKNQYPKNKVLSKITQLSQQYMELTNQLNIYQNKNDRKNLSYRPHTQANEKIANKIKSCQFIQQVVQNLLVQNGQNKNSNEKKVQSIRNLSSIILKGQREQNINIQDKNKRNSMQKIISLQSISQNKKQQIKNLFFSLGLVDIQKLQQQNISLKQITQIAKNNYNQIKGQTHEQKINEMILSLKMRKSNLINKQIKLISANQFQQNDQFFKTPLQFKDQGQSHSGNRKFKKRPQIFLKQKKVKLISPQTLSQLNSKRQQLQKQLLTSISFLSNSRLMKKFCFKTQKIIQIQLNFSNDFKFMSYLYLQQDCISILGKMINPKQKISQKCKIISLANNLISVTKGTKTRNLISYQQNDQKRKQIPKMNQKNCFSLLFKDRSYDFQCQNQSLRDQYYKYIKIMIKNTNKFQ